MTHSRQHHTSSAPMANNTLDAALMERERARRERLINLLCFMSGMIVSAVLIVAWVNSSPLPV